MRGRSVWPGCGQIKGQNDHSCYYEHCYLIYVHLMACDYLPLFDAKADYGIFLSLVHKRLEHAQRSRNSNVKHLHNTGANVINQTLYSNRWGRMVPHALYAHFESQYNYTYGEWSLYKI